MNSPAFRYAPEISGLIRRCGTVKAAEEAARLPQGLFHLIREGRREYTSRIEERVKNAIIEIDQLTKERKVVPRPLEIPDTCPPLLADLLRETQSKQRARQILSCGEKLLKNVIEGAEMPKSWEIKIKAHLGQPVLPGVAAAASQEAPQDGAPVFVPWDGKTKGTVEIAAWGKAKGRKIKNVPQPIVDLVNKYGKVSQAAAAMGMTGGALMNWMDLQRPFDLVRQKKVHAAMHGMPGGGGVGELGESFDKYSLGLAICLLKGHTYDRIAEVADILNGTMVFRKNTNSGWIIIYKMHVDDLPRFKKLAMRDASEIVCP